MARFRTPSKGRFRPRPRRSPRNGLLSWWNLWRVPTLVTIVAAIWWFGVRPVTDEQGWVPVDERFSLCGGADRTRGCVVDGDTLFISERGARPRRVRLTGFDAPELNAACAPERELAAEAREALLDWLNRGPFEWSGAEDPPHDQYGRELREIRRLRSDGAPEYLSQALIEAGLADDTGWGASETDWCR
ncbi:MAG: hypothetical protein QNI87_06680 [Erythrobacter sp.]|uniref:thermonuclease family protein n=1 Tax=Erythrobacter sp. TaxID=1042 RepID=UPI0026139078|nr:hypothetical protein [Erythrobacter sp.]MDJ0978202.1 hypothetical protein [Erythrobacter sp.]